MAKNTNNTKKSMLPVVVIALVVLVAVGVALYFGKSMLPTTVKNLIPGASNSLDESMFKDINDPLIRKHFAAQYSHKNYKITSTSSGMGENTKTEMILDLNDPSKTQITTSENGKLISDQINADKTVYVYEVKTGEWWMEKLKDEKTKLDKNPAPNTEQLEQLKKDKLDSLKASYVSLGEEACGDLVCYKYEEKLSTENAGSRMFWFDKNKFLLRREQNSYGEFTSTSTYEYDVKITLPTNAKQVPEGKSAYDYLGYGTQGSMNYEDAKKEAEKLIKDTNFQNINQFSDDNSETMPDTDPEQMEY